jgi:EAL domain-containing protein (putative c-di-GMP-specific phosphodiesterase class I)
MRRVIYGWRAGSQISIDAQTAGEALARIEKSHNGLLEPEMVVDAARDEASPLHPHFEWDDAAAAEEFRKDQARELVRALTVDISRSNLEQKTVRAFVNVETGGERGYLSTFTAMSSEQLRKQVLERAFAELEAWRARHAELSELARIFAAIDETRPAIKGD